MDISNEYLVKEYNDYTQLIHFALTKKLHIRNINNFRFGIYDYDDYFSEGKIGLLKAIRSYDESKGSKTTYYLYGVLYEIYHIHQFACTYTRLANMNTVSLDKQIEFDNYGSKTTVIDETSDNYNYWNDKTNIILINDCIEKADLTNKELFVLKKHTEGYSRKEIANMLDVSCSMISQHLLCVRKKVKDSLNIDHRLKIINSEIKQDIKCHKYNSKSLKKYYLFDDGRKKVLVYNTFDYINKNIFPYIKSKTLRSYMYKKVKINNRYYLFKSLNDLNKHKKGVM